MTFELWFSSLKHFYNLFFPQEIGNKSLYSPLFQRHQSPEKFYLSEVQLADTISLQQVANIDFYRVTMLSAGTFQKHPYLYNWRGSPRTASPMGQGCRKGSPVNVSVSLLKAGFERGKGSKPGLPGCKTGITPLSSIELKPLKIIRAKFSPSGHGCTGWL